MREHIAPLTARVDAIEFERDAAMARGARGDCLLYKGYGIVVSLIPLYF